MDINTIRGLVTLLVMITFIGVWAWAWSSRRKRDFEEAANLPFSNETAGEQEQREGDRK